VQILRHLLSNNAEGCREFVKLMGEMLKKAREEDSEFPWGECVGLFTLLSVLIRSTDIEPFPTVHTPKRFYEIFIFCYFYFY
jgi:hypothetical protein